MKIVETDNHGSDYPDENVIIENLIDVDQANMICDALNKRFCSNDSCSRFYIVVNDDYVLQPGFEP